MPRISKFIRRLILMHKRIRVVQLFYTFDIEVGGGGLSLFAIELGKRLDPEKFEVSLCSLGYYDTSLGKERILRLNQTGIRAYEATDWDDSQPYQSFTNSLRTLNRELKKNPVDLLHSHSEYTDITAMLLKLRQRAPRILRTVHYGFHEEWNRKPLRRALLTNFSYPILFDAEIGINNANTERLNRRFLAKVLQKKAIRIPNAISFERFTNIHVDVKAKKESLSIPPDAPIIGTVGRLADQKGFIFLIDAAHLVLQEYPQIHFLIVGDGPLADEHREQARSLGIEKQVLFTGGRTDVDELLVCMDLFASSSLWEGLPTVILEAMAANVPTLATDIPGSNELIQHGINGWLVPPYTPDALSEGILHLMKSPPLRAKLAQQAKETLVHYSIDSIASEYESLYQRLYNK